jgi:hypothetical protein
MSTLLIFMGAALWLAIGTFALSLEAICSDRPLSVAEILFAYTLAPPFFVVAIVVVLIVAGWRRIWS